MNGTDFGSSANTSKGFNELKAPGTGGVSMNTAVTMRGGTNENVSQGEPSAKNVSGSNVKQASGNDQGSINSKLSSMDKGEMKPVDNKEL